MKPFTELAICGPKVVSSELIRVESLGVQLGRSLIDEPGDVESARYLVGDLVGQDVLDGRVINQRLHGRHVPVGIGNQVAYPYAEDGFRSEHAAEHDEDDGHEGPPAEVPSAPRASLRLMVELSRLSAQPLQLSPLILAEFGVRCRQLGVRCGQLGVRRGRFWLRRVRVSRIRLRRIRVSRNRLRRVRLSRRLRVLGHHPMVEARGHAQHHPRKVRGRSSGTDWCAPRRNRKPPRWLEANRAGPPVGHGGNRPRKGTDQNVTRSYLTLNIESAIRK